VVASVVLERTAMRAPAQEEVVWPDPPPDPDLVKALAAPADRTAVFEYGLQALLRQIAAG
jgi:hypothetical protein